MPVIYLVSANPFPDRPLRIDVEQRAILRRLPASWDIKLAPAARITDIVSDLRRYSPDIVHFSAHGSPMERVVLLDGDGKPTEISRVIIDNLFKVMKEKIRLVIMNSCYSRTQAQDIAEYIDCVIGTDNTIKDDNAITFAGQFYEALVAGRSVGKAVEEAGILLSTVPSDHKPALISKSGVNPDSVIIAVSRRRVPRQALPAKVESPAAPSKKLLAERKRAFEVAADRYDVRADRFSMLKIGSPDGSYVIHCEIEGLCAIRNPIEAVNWGFNTGSGLVIAPDLSEVALAQGIRWETKPDPPANTYGEVLKNLGTLRGKFIFTSPLKPNSTRSFAWTMQVLNADALTTWEFYNLYSKEDQIDIDDEPLNGPPSEYFAKLVWFPVREMIIGVRLPASQVSPLQFRYFELKNLVSSDIPSDQVRSNGSVRNGPDYDSAWGKLNAKWRRNIDVEKSQTISPAPAAELRVQYPIMGSYYSLNWRLPDPELPTEIERLCGEAHVIRYGLLAHREARRDGPGNTQSALIKTHFKAVHKAASSFLHNKRKDSSFTTTLLTWDHSERRLVVVEVCRNNGKEVEAEWNFWAPFGLGVTGMCFRSGTHAFRYKHDLDHGTHERPENYLRFPGMKPHAYLFSLPIDHPEMTEDLAALPNSQRSRQLVGVLSIASYSPASPLLEYCRENISDSVFAELRDLRDTCQKKMDVISRLLLESDQSGEIPHAKAPTNAAALKPQLVTSTTISTSAPVVTAPDPSVGKIVPSSITSGRNGDGQIVPQNGILLQPGHAWVSPIAHNKYRFKVAAFDLDGSLIRGDKYVFSWELVWRTLGFGRSVQNELRREYHRRADKSPSRETRGESYRQWCESAIQKFKECDLTRDQLREMAKSLRLTANCREALRVLRAEGMVTALISGGINVFLEDVFPDFRDYFDFVFINELVFSPFGMISGVKATAYDFEGKGDALALVRERAGATADQTVFVGDHYNDKAVMTQAKKAIAYPSNDSVPDDVSHATISDDNLMAVLPHILLI